MWWGKNISFDLHLLNLKEYLLCTKTQKIVWAYNVPARNVQVLSQYVFYT
jgi:hypothetical protein